jgi:uncharacterized protein YjiS (DUF1127 family)
VNPKVPMGGADGQRTEETEMRKPLSQLLTASQAAVTRPLVHAEIEAWAMRAAAANGFGGDPASLREPTYRPAAAAPAAFIDLSDPLASAVVRARRYARRAVALLRLVRRRSRYRAQARRLQQLDPATLRDLGLSRSEIGSLLAEATGRAPATRRQFVQHELFRPRAGEPVGLGTSF